MKNPFKRGDIKLHEFEVGKSDVAKFESGLVHEVCSTFKLGKEMEWSSRLFVLDMIDPDEEGVGTRLEIEHHAPAFIGDRVQVKAVFRSFEVNELLCDVYVKVGERKVASGLTGQKVLKKEKISQIFSSLKN